MGSQRAEGRPRSRRAFSPATFLFAAFLLVLLAAASRPASASSYSGTDDWTIPFGTTEVVVGENITVSGHLFVEGNLTLVNSTLQVLGRIGEPPPPPPPPAPPTPIPARESARIYVNGTFELANSTLDLYFPFDGPAIPGAIARIPPGMRVGSRGAVLVHDFDNDPSTPDDASFIHSTGPVESPRNGSYSRFAAGSVFIMTNSRASNLGIEGYPGFEFNGTSVSIEGSQFRSSRRAMVATGSQNVWVANSTFTNVAQPISVAGGSNHRFTALTIFEFTVGLNLTNVSDTELRDLSIRFGLPQINYTGWAPQGSSIAVGDSTNITIARLDTEGNTTENSSEPLQVFWLRNVANLAIDSVTVLRPWGIGRIEGATPLTVRGLTGTAFGNGLELVDCTFVTLSDFALDGNALYGTDILGGRNIQITNFTAHAWRGLRISGATSVYLGDVALTVTQAGLQILDTSDFTVTGLTVLGNGTGLWFHNVTLAGVDKLQLQFSFWGLQITYSSFVTVTAPVLTSPMDGKGNMTVFIVESSDVRISSLTFAGTCESAGRVDRTHRVTLDGFAVSTCDAGLSVSEGSDFILLDASITGTWNGTALGIYNMTNGLVARATLTGSGGYALAVTASFRVTLRDVAGSGAAVGGAIVVLSSEVTVVDSDFSRSGGVGIVVLNATGVVTLQRVNASGGREGLQVLGSPGGRYESVYASDNLREGVYIEPRSTGTVLYRLSIARNGGAGLSVGAPNVEFVDGSILSNRGYGIDASPGIRLDWRIEGVGSLVDDEWRMTGNLLVLGGATFLARNATLRVDEGAGLFDPDPEYRIEVHARAVFDNATLEPANASRAHGVLFGVNSVVEIRASYWVGGDRTDARSAVVSRGSLGVWLSNFTNWAAPIFFDGDAVLVSDTIFSDNAAGPEFRGASAILTNLTSELEQGDGLILKALARAQVLGGELRFNDGVGLRAAQVGVLTIEGLNLSLNLQGGAAIVGSDVAAVGLTVAVNNVLGLYISGGGRAEFTDLVVRANTGRSLLITQTREVDLFNFSITYSGGTGLELETVQSAKLTQGELFQNGAGGLRALDALELIVEAVRFEANANYQVSLEGATLATFQNSSFVNAPGDAVLLSGSAKGFLLEVRLAGAVGRVRAQDTAYAYVLNTSFTGPSVTSAAQVDIAWDVRVIVRLSSGGAAAGAAVELRDLSDVITAQSVTGPEGDSPIMPILQQSVFSGGRVNRYSPHTAVASLPGQGAARVPSDIDSYTEIRLTLDSVPPTLTVFIEGTAGENGWYVSGVTVSLEARDDGPNGVTVLWRLGGGLWQNQTATGNFVSAFFSIEDEGQTLLEYIAEDGVGNARPLNSSLVRIDLSAPTVAWGTVPTLVRGASVALQWSGHDGAGSGGLTYAVEVSLDNGPETPWINNTTAASAVFTAEWEGKYKLRLTAVDRAGRSSQSASVTFDLKILGTLRLAVVDANGLPLRSAQVDIVDTNESRTGAGDLSFRLTEGHYRLRVRAPGYEERLLEGQVFAGNTTDLGPVQLTQIGAANTGADVSALLIGLLVAAVAGGVAIFVTLRSKRKTSEHEEEMEGRPGGRR